MSDVSQETRSEPVAIDADPFSASGGQAQRLSDRVLLVEDNPVVQRVTIAMLEHLGYCADVVDNGVEAVIAAAMVPYRAILMDCQIPVLNGYEATFEIRRQWGASRCSPIIAVSASSSEPDRQRCLAAGMDGHLAKPLSLETLAAGMARWSPDPSDLAVATDAVGSPPLPDDPPAPTEFHPPALDARVVGRLKRLGAAAGEDLLGQLTTVFLADSDTRIMALRQALAREDGPTLIHVAHTLCGAAANLGAAELARLCAHLATDGAVGGIDDGEALVDSVEDELGRVRRALTSPSPSVSPSSPTPVPTPLP